MRALSPAAARHLPRRGRSARALDVAARAAGALLVLAALACAGEGPTADPEPTMQNDDLTSLRGRIARTIREYDAQGVHRTGTEVDTASAHWLAGLVREAGVEPVLDSLPFERVDTEAAYLEVTNEYGGTARYDGIPLVDSATFTDAEGVRGELGRPEHGTPIAVARYPATVQYWPEFHEIRTRSEHRALVVVTGGDAFDVPEGPLVRAQPPGYALINADRFSDPYGIPVLQLPSGAGPALVRAREQRLVGRVVVQTKRTPTSIYNVEASVTGREPSAAPLVVMTPRSGWWEVASERGGGIALWVEILRTLAAEPPRRTVHFVASTGHELGHVGLDHYLEKNHDRIAHAHLWLHLGANFAAAVGPAVRIQASSPELLDRARGAMAAREVPPDVVTEVETRPFGEAREIHDGGGRFISLLGANGQFHSPLDRWPDSVDLPKTERLAQAFIALVVEIANEGEAAG